MVMNADMTAMSLFAAQKSRRLKAISAETEVVEDELKKLEMEISNLFLQMADLEALGSGVEMEQFSNIERTAFEKQKLLEVREEGLASLREEMD